MSHSITNVTNGMTTFISNDKLALFNNSYWLENHLC